MATDLIIANTIAQQIGHRAFVMMGTQHKGGDHNSLSFNVRGSKVCNSIKITLDPSDTYTITFFKRGRAPKYEVKSWSVSDIYVDSMHECIERHTGLYLSLGTMGRKSQ